MNSRRRSLVFLVTLLLGLPAAFAQPPALIAWLGAGSESGSADFVAAFKQGLEENGLLEGQQYILDARYADNRYERFGALVQDLLQRDPAVIMVVTVSSVRAAQRATTKVPIVMMSTNDPVASGLVASLARPGGNTTGLGNMAEDIAEKYLQLLQELFPRARRLAVLSNPDNPSNAAVFERVREAARKSKIDAREVKLSSVDDLDAVFDALARDRPDVLALASDLSFMDRRGRICALAAKHQIPVFAHAPEFANAGCLIGFGSPRLELYRRSASYVKKILNGANPGDLPVELPMRFELAINLKTARALKLSIPNIILLRADKVIE